MDPDATAAEKQDLASELCDLCDHTDPFTLQYKAGLVTAAEVLSEENLNFTRDCFINCPVANVISEASFAASHVRRQTDLGNAPALPTKASAHVLGASKTSLDLHVASHSSRWVELATRTGATATGRWKKFLAANRQRASMRDLAAEWPRMTEAQKDAAGAVAQCPRRLVSKGPGAKLPPPWPYCGDSCYPLGLELLEDVSKGVPRLSEMWQCRVGTKCIAPGRSFEAKPSPNCEAVWGRCVCVDELPVVAARSLGEWKRRANRWGGRSPRSRRLPSTASGGICPCSSLEERLAQQRAQPTLAGSRP